VAKARTIKAMVAAHTTVGYVNHLHCRCLSQLQQAYLIHTVDRPSIQLAETGHTLWHRKNQKYVNPCSVLTSYTLLTGPAYSLLMPRACICSTMYQMPALTTMGPVG
jgi:hypothetical protein